MSVPQPWHPADYDEADAGALKALNAGNANEAQQKRALAYIINTLAGTYEETFYPEERNSAYAQGRRYVGLQIVKLLNLPASAFRPKKKISSTTSKRVYDRSD